MASRSFSLCFTLLLAVAFLVVCNAEKHPHEGVLEERVGDTGHCRCDPNTCHCDLPAKFMVTPRTVQIHLHYEKENQKLEVQFDIDGKHLTTERMNPRSPFTICRRMPPIPQHVGQGGVCVEFPEYHLVPAAWPPNAFVGRVRAYYVINGDRWNYPTPLTNFNMPLEH